MTNKLAKTSEKNLSPHTEAFASLPEDIKKSLKPIGLEKGQWLCRQGEKPDGLYFLTQGKLMVAFDGRHGEGGALAIMETPCVIGDLELFTESPTTCTVIAAQQASLLHLSAACAYQTGFDDPAFLRFLLGQLRHKLHAASMNNHMKGASLRHRLTVYLLNTMDDDGKLELLKRHDMASLLGTTERHLNRILRQLREENLIVMQRTKVTIPYPALLTP